MSRGTFFIVAAAAMVASQSQAAVQLQYASTMPQDQVERLNADLQALSAMQFEDASGELKRIMKIPDTKTPSLEHWLSERAHFVVGENFVVDDSSVVPIEVINIAQTSATTPATDQPQQPRKARIVMSNLGAALYAFGKDRGFVLGVKLEGDHGVELRSPRAGLFKVGEGLFQLLDPRLPATALGGFLHIAFRMGTLFHESRHDDGNKSSLAFSHTICPEGHDYAGLAACDTPSNGPYRIGSLFYKGLIEGCGATGCRTGEREILTMIYADNMNRILSPIAQPKAALASDLCAKVNKVKPGNRLCNAQTVASAAIEWDDSPEVISESK